MDRLFDIVRWIVRDPTRKVIVQKRTKNGDVRNVTRWEPLPPGKGGLVIEEKMRFLELAYLCGFQSAQRSMGINEHSPDFAVDVQVSRTMYRKGTTKLLGWSVQKRNGTRLEIPHGHIVRKSKWKAGKVPVLKVPEQEREVAPLFVEQKRRKQ